MRVNNNQFVAVAIAFSVVIGSFATGGVAANRATANSEIDVEGAVAERSKSSSGGSGIELDNLDRSVKPCEDFNRFANGGWIAKNPVPAEYSSWGTPQILRERNLEQLHTILEAASTSKAPKGSNEQKIGDFYYSVMDTRTRDAEGLRPLAPWLKRIEQLKDTRDLQAAFAYLATYNVDSPFGVGSTPDLKNSRQVIAEVSQSGISLPDRDYYLKDDDKSKTIREEYVKHIATTFELIGEDPAKAKADALAVMEIETRLAGASLTRIELRNPNGSYHPMTPEERKTLTPNLDWEFYTENVGLKGLGTMNVAQPKFFKEVDSMLTQVPVEQWKTYLRWRLVSFLSPTLSTPFEQESFDFNSRVLAGTKEQQALWKRAVSATSARLGEAVGQLYVKKYFPPDSKERITKMVANLRAALREDIQHLDWMSDPTRKQALAKLDALAEKIGYPDKWTDYGKLELDRGAYALNMLRVEHWSLVRDLEKVGKTVDRDEWLAPPQTINAGYIPFRNEIIFPAAILQAPLFDPAADDAVNYGAVGAIIGHEMTHGFDDQGGQFDADGNLKRWWTPEDYTKFQARTTCVEAQFEAYTLDDGTHLKGKLVKGEAVADLGGLRIAWLAYQKSLEGKPRPKDLDGFTPEQRFFLGFGQAWKLTERPEAEHLQTNTDPHPLARFRLNGTVSNMPEFFNAFGCGDGEKMVWGKDRCEIW
jgi:putative endopeptidase